MIDLQRLAIQLKLKELLGNSPSNFAVSTYIAEVLSNPKAKLRQPFLISDKDCFIGRGYVMGSISRLKRTGSIYVMFDSKAEESYYRIDYICQFIEENRELRFTLNIEDYGTKWWVLQSEDYDSFINLVENNGLICFK